MTLDSSNFSPYPLISLYVLDKESLILSNWGIDFPYLICKSKCEQIQVGQRGIKHDSKLKNEYSLCRSW